MLLDSGGMFQFDDEAEKNSVANILKHPGWKLIEQAFMLKSFQAQRRLLEFTAETVATEFEVGRMFGNSQAEVEYFQDIVRLLRDRAIDHDGKADENDDDLLDLEMHGKESRHERREDGSSARSTPV